MGLQFHETMYGKNFFEHQLPRLTKAIEKLADQNNKQETVPSYPFQLWMILRKQKHSQGPSTSSL